MRGATHGERLCDISSVYFNPRTPCGVRLSIISKIAAFYEFQSTHPMRGATVLREMARGQRWISIHAPHAGCDLSVLRNPASLNDISIHAPHAGCDRRTKSTSSRTNQFQSTHPMRGATCGAGRRSGRPADFNPRTPCGVRRIVDDHRVRRVVISIHAPHAGCDLMLEEWKNETLSISIHAPHAGCDGQSKTVKSCHGLFQSTHPMRGATR